MTTPNTKFSQPSQPTLVIKFCIPQLPTPTTLERITLIRVVPETTMSEAAHFVEDALAVFQATLKKGLHAQIDSVRLTWN